jgi:hypothetical protein
MGGELRRDVTLALETDAAADLLLLFNLFPTPTAFTHFSSLVSDQPVHSGASYTSPTGSGSH